MKYLAVFKRNKPKERWQIASKIITSLDLAKQCSDKIISTLHKNGYELAEVSIQSFTDKYNIPESLNDVKSEKLLVN